MVRSRFLLGYDVDYVPGWDCHGLPIEWKIEEELRAKGRRKDEVSRAEFRTRCREYAAHWIDVQTDGVQAPGRARRLGQPLRHHGLSTRGRDRRRVPQVRGRPASSIAAPSR